MGCAQAKPGHPNTTNKNHQTNHLSSTPNQGHTREVIKTKNHSNDPLLQQGHQQHVKQNRQKSHNLLIQQKDNIKQLEQNSHSNNKNSNKKTGLQQLLDSQGNRKQQKSLSQSLSKSKSKGRNPMNLIQNDISPIQIRVRNENDQEENEDEFDTNSDNGQNDVKNNLNQSKQKNTVKNNNNNNLQLQKNMRKKDNNNQQQQNIDDICLGVESKVEDQYKNNNKNNNNTNNNKNNKNKNNNNTNNNNKTVQQIKTKLLTQSQKNISDNLNKKPFNHNLFYSQHHVAVKDQINGQSPNKTNKINREQMNYTTKENKNTTKSLRKQTNEEEYSSYFEENHNNNNNKNTHLNNYSKSVKSQLPNKNDFSLLQENSQQKTSKTMTNFNKKKLNQFHSVIENKQKLLEDKAKEIKVKKSQQKQENIDDYLIQEHDQQGSVRAPLETSYHAPSKRTIQQQKLSSSKKDISLSSQSLSRSKKPTLKYIAQLDNPAITERPSQMEKQDNQLEEGKSLQQIQHLRKSSKLETAFFKTSSSKQMLQAQTDQKNLIQQQQLKLSMGKKKTGPILFSQISFKDKDDSDYVPQEGSYVNGLQMSVHLNIAQHF